MLNSFVHIVMYFYYMVAAMGPKYQKYIWWKKYLTSFQMLQFIAIFTHQFQLILRPDCDYPKGFMVWIGLHGIMFLFLFSDFYKAKYRSVTRGLADKKAKMNGGGALKTTKTGNGVAAVTENGNQGACMVSELLSVGGEPDKHKSMKWKRDDYIFILFRGVLVSCTPLETRI